MANSYLSRTQTAGTRTKATFSAWVKRSKLGANQAIFGIYGAASDAGQIEIRFQSSGEGFHISGQATNWRRTNRAFRDVNGWYHLVVAFDTTQSTADDRVKVYVNGVQETSFAASGNPAEDASLPFGLSGATCVVGCNYNAGSAGDYFEGYMSHVALVDGAALTPSSFGQTDSTSGIWKFKSPSGITWGNNGFHLKMENSGNLGLDSSGQTNNLTTNGDLKQAIDNPSNVYCTINPLVRNQVTLTTNNLTVRSPSTNWMGIPATMGVSSGKWYWEYKLALGNAWSQCGVMSSIQTGGYNGIYSTYVGNLEGGLALNSGQGDFYHDGSSGAYSTSAWFSGGLAEYDIIGVALDATNSKIWFARNGTWGNSSNPATGSGGIDFSGDADFTNHKPYFPAFSVHNCIITINFGNGYFGTAAISSAGSNGNGSLFEYDVPSGFYALTTKNINTYG